MFVIMQCFSDLALLISITVVLFSTASADISYSGLRICDDTPDCLKNTIQSKLPEFVKGYPELDIDTLDPFIVENLNLLLPGGLKITFYKGFSKGLRNCIVDRASLQGDNAELEIQCNFTIKGKYKSSGRLLMFSINGDGESMIKSKNLRIKCSFRLGTTIGADGEKYLNILDLKTRHSFEGQVVYRLTNLLKGNPQLSNVIVEFMNRNWRLVAEEFGGPIVDFGVTTVMRNVRKFIEAVPMSQFVL